MSYSSRKTTLIASTLGAYLAGYVFDRMGHYQLVFWIGVAVSLTGAILAALLTPATKKQ